MSFASAGLIDANVASGILMYLRRETDYVPWAAAKAHLDKISELFGGKNEVFNVSFLNFKRIWRLTFIVLSFLWVFFGKLRLKTCWKIMSSRYSGLIKCQNMNNHIYASATAKQDAQNR